MAADQMMENNSDHEDQEALIFHSYPYAAYYVQSPSTLSHTNSVNAVDVRNLHSTTSTHSSPANDAVSGFTTLSRYSSNDEDVLSLLKGHKTKMIGVIPGGIHQKEGAINRLIIVDHDDEDDDDDEDDENNDGGKKKRGCWWRYMSFRRSDNNACGWIALQIFWRLLFSLGVALLVFYIATNPPHPNISIKVRIYTAYISFINTYIYVYIDIVDIQFIKNYVYYVILSVKIHINHTSSSKSTTSNRKNEITIILVK